MPKASSKDLTNPFKLLNFSSPKDSQKSQSLGKGRSHKVMSSHFRRQGRVSNLTNHETVTDAGKMTFTEGGKDDEVCNNTTDTVKYKSESIDEYFGIFPNKYWCLRCEKEVLSKVTLNLPTLSV
jgi:hypothetical protein